MTYLGQRDKEIDIEAQVKVPDGMGGFQIFWKSILPTGTKIHAAIWPISSSEKTEALSRGVDITHRVNIQYRGKFSTAWRIKYNGRYFSIVGKIDPNEAHRELQFTCKEAV